MSRDNSLEESSTSSAQSSPIRNKKHPRPFQRPRSLSPPRTSTIVDATTNSRHRHKHLLNPLHLFNKNKKKNSKHQKSKSPLSKLFPPNQLHIRSRSSSDKDDENQSIASTAKTSKDGVRTSATEGTPLNPRSPKKYDAATSTTINSIAISTSSPKALGVSFQTDADTKKTTIIIGPWMEVMTRDATLFVLITVLIAIYPTWINWPLMIRAPHQASLGTMLCWMLVAGAVGNFLATMRMDQESKRTHSKTTQSAVRSIAAVPGKRASVDDSSSEKRKRHSVLMQVLRASSSDIQFQSAASHVTGDANEHEDEQCQTTWRTALNKASQGISSQYLWEKTVDVTKDVTHQNNRLMQRLLKNPMLKRRTKADVSVLQKESQEDKDSTPEQNEIEENDIMSNARVSSNSKMGSLEIPYADTLHELVIVPIATLRGVDIFITDDAESDAATHPWLIDQGLRDVPTLVINVVTPWGSILIYMEFPRWVTQFDGTYVIDDNDEDDVKALKMFINGDADYRNKRAKIIPSVVDGPFAIRVLAPPKRELCVNCAALPIYWRTFPAGTDPRTGRQLKPAIEAELDCVSNPVIRSLAGILKRSLSNLAIDVAIIIQKPDNQVEDEPQACLGMFRFNYVDISLCPEMPDRYSYIDVHHNEKDLARQVRNSDVLRASKLVKMSSVELDALTKDHFA